MFFCVFLLFSAPLVGADSILLRAALGSGPHHGGSADELLFAAHHREVLGEISYSTTTVDHELPVWSARRRAPTAVLLNNSSTGHVVRNRNADPGWVSYSRENSGFLNGLFLI